jgi:Fe2+ transport system protein FeoA
MQTDCLIDDGKLSDTNFQMQVAVNRRKPASAHVGRAITTLKRGESGILDRIELPEPDARRLMEMGFLPGHAVIPARSAPGGDPRVYQVDGSEVALRRETARHLILR